MNEYEISDLLSLVGGQGRMSSLAYDTAWVARLVNIDPQMGNSALDWICAHQLPDGSWGAENIFYYHDRVINTLAAMISLSRGRRSSDRNQIQRGQTALDRITAGATQGLENDPNGATVGFEMIAPALAGEAEQLGLIANQGARILGRLAKARQRKLNLLGKRLINRHITAAFSAEMAGSDGIQKLDLGNLKEPNGSVGHSPAATAYYLLRIRPNDHQALNYLKRIANDDGGFPDLIPFDVFETSWTIWNLMLAGCYQPEKEFLFKPLLDNFWHQWTPKQGIGLSAGYSIPDGDDTAIVFEILSRAGYEPDIDAVLSFEESDHFRTYHLEADSSNSVNCHVLSALRQAGRKIDDPSVQKALSYLKRKRVAGSFWFDKWNLSPFYTTAHVVIACSGFANELVAPSIEWILHTRNNNGSWGRQIPTAEETAYCLQALCVWIRNGGQPTVATNIIHDSAKWLAEHANPPYPPLWIGKGLYCPENVVRSAIFSALTMARES